MKLGLENSLGVFVHSDSFLVPWIIRHSSWTITGHQVKSSGRTAYESMKHKKYNGEVCNFGEIVYARHSGKLI